MYSFCTYFDRHYLPRALALYESLARHCANFHLFALCLDEESRFSLEKLNLQHSTVLTLGQLEQAYPALSQLRMQRSRVEYYYTCGPSFLLYVLDCFPSIELITYLDSDLYFFSDPKPLFDELEEYSVGIIEHKLAPRLGNRLNKFGRYNVGWVSFRRDESGLCCLRWWRDQCIEWCYDRVEEGKFADQKYLEQFPVLFDRVHAIQHKGANVAPWNVTNYRITDRDGEIWVDEQPLVFFHFHGFKALAAWLFDTNLGSYWASPSALVRRKIFYPYIQELRRTDSRFGPVRSITDRERNSSRGLGVLMRAARISVRVSCGLLRRAYIVDFPGGTL